MKKQGCGYYLCAGINGTRTVINLSFLTDSLLGKQVNLEPYGVKKIRSNKISEVLKNFSDAQRIFSAFFHCSH